MILRDCVCSSKPNSGPQFGLQFYKISRMNYKSSKCLNRPLSHDHKEDENESTQFDSGSLETNGKFAWNMVHWRDVSLVTISHDPGFNILEMLINRAKTNALAIYNRFQVTKMIIYIFLKDLPILYHWNDCAKNDDLLFITVWPRPSFSANSKGACALCLRNSMVYLGCVT